MFSSRTLACLLFSFLALALPAWSQDGRLPERDASLNRAERADRDLRVSFSAGAAERAREVLGNASSGELGDWDLRYLSSALMALGAGGESADLPALERYAEAGKLSLRRAAFFAIGEMGIRGYATMERLLAGHLVGAEEVALLALIRMDQGSRVEPRLALQLVLDACDDYRPGLSNAALYMRDYALGGPAPAALVALDSYYDLRWAAGCAFGFVDGLRWEKLRLRVLASNPEYLNRFALSLLGGLDQAKQASHLIELLSMEHGPGVITGIVEGVPGFLPSLYRELGWRPASLGEWAELLQGVENLPNPSGYSVILLDVFNELPAGIAFGPLRERAALLLLESGEDVPRSWVQQAVSSHDVRLQERLLGIGGSYENEFMLKYAQRILASTKNTRVAIAAQLALARMGADGAEEYIQELILNASPSVRQILLELLESLSFDPRIYGLFRTSIEAQDPDPAAWDWLAFAATWRPIPDGQRERVRTALRGSQGTQKSRRRALERLLVEPSEEDLILCRELFPMDGELGLNLLIARGLVSRDNQHTRELLRSLLWGDNWNMAVLAGGLGKRIFGVRFLLDELSTPPEDASDHSLRCVGFALGEWAGQAAVEELARIETARDPALQGAYLGALSSSQE